MWTGDLPEQPDGQPRARKRVFHQNFFRQAQILANPANLVLEEIPQRLDQRKRHFFRQSADVVVSFDRRRRPFDGDRLDHVWIESSLYQVTHLPASFPRLALLPFYRTALAK